MVARGLAHRPTELDAAAPIAYPVAHRVAARAGREPRVRYRPKE